MQLIVEWALPRFAVLPIGDGLTMGVDDAIRAAKWLGVKHVVGVHYDTFPFIKIDHENAIALFNRADLTLHLPAIGSTIDL
jgi:L-ascorbate metabolism protein UlaG (beta-lactamase superfamily)